MATTREPGHRLLVPLDGSSLAAQAIPYVRALAAPGAEVLLLWVVPEPETLRGGVTGRVLFSEEDILRADEEAAQKALGAVAERLRRVDGALRVEVAVAVGDPAEAIVEVAAERGADLIVVASHGRGAVGRWVFGSVADRVARTAPVPVAIVRPVAGEGAPVADVTVAGRQRLVVPLDGSDLASRALAVAGQLAKRLGLPILLLNVVEPAAWVSPLVAAGMPYADPGYEAIRSDLRATGGRLLRQAAERLEAAGLAVTWQVLDGSPATGVLGSERPSDLIVLTSHGRSGVRRWLLGSVAEKLVREGVAPVLLVPSAAEPDDRAVSDDQATDDPQPTEADDEG